MEKRTGILLDTHFVNKLSMSGELGWFSREFNPSTGYSWSCIPDNSGVLEMVEEIVLHPSVAAVGVPGMIIWKFKAVKEGKGSILIELFPPAGKEPAEKIVINIEVAR